MSLMLNEINLTYFLSYSQPPRDRIKELLLIGYIYFRIFKKEMPDLREYCYFNNSSHGRKSDKTFYSIIKRNSKSTKNAMQILTVRRIFQVYQTLFSNIKKEDPYGLSFAEFIKTQRGSYMVKTCFLQDVLKCIGEEW